MAGRSASEQWLPSVFVAGVDLTLSRQFGIEMTLIFAKSRETAVPLPAIHKNLLFTNSPFFNRNLGACEKGVECGGNLTIDGYHPDAISAVLAMIAYGAPAPSLAQGEEGLAYIDLHLLAVRFCAAGHVKDSIMDALIKHHVDCGRLLSLRFARETYENTSEGSMLREYVVRGVSFAIEREGVDSEAGWPTEDFITLPADFQRDHMRLFRSSEQQGRWDPRETDPCKFHVHGGDNLCYRKAAARADGDQGFKSFQHVSTSPYVLETNTDMGDVGGDAGMDFEHAGMASNVDFSTPAVTAIEP
ncbi:hypothetical protein BJ875DRAFT_483134 [Amylocarpus encephaloides]|uniref:BTB domain-containing protein n=1 Tax=Amylocarpus encephaloides TaxID=45428 RepID=A0A9P7YKM4_9HELO|nr:hypothetical protein BJ875DRAFT_483134 [Amylocarpus encephaloides]